MLGKAKVAVLVVTLLVLSADVWTVVTRFLPMRDYGIAWDFSNGNVLPGVEGPAQKAGIVAGDRVLELPRGDVVRGFHDYRLEWGELDEPLRVATRHGVVTIHSAVRHYSQLEVVSAQLTGTVLTSFALLLFLRRPGSMAFAFWLATLFGVPYQLYLHVLPGWPDRLAATVWVPFFAFFMTSGIAYVPFALRFPTGRISDGARWWDRFAWICFAAAFACAAAFEIAYLGGRANNGELELLTEISGAPVLLAAGILVGHYLRGTAVDRSQIAWAIAGFGGSLLLNAFGDALYGQWEFLNRVLGEVVFERVYFFSQVISNLLPLLAIYPILRYRLFDLGFVINRAALYTILTLAAVGTLTAVNWLAQHVADARLSSALQPVAAVVIGLGFMRARAWTQRALERFLFHARFVAEQHVAAAIKRFSMVEHPEVLDASLTADAAATFALQSAAVFRLTDGRLERRAAVGWAAADLASLKLSDELIRRLMSDSPLSLQAGRWHPGGLPEEPRTPVVAIGLLRGTMLHGIVFYGRHVNGTEIDPEEMKLLRSLCDAAASAYGEAAMRARIEKLEHHVLALEALRA